MTKAVIKKHRKSVEVVRNAFYELSKILGVCISARNLFEIYHKLELDSSELVADRITYYKNRIDEDLELLREVHNSLQNADHSHSSAHSDLLYNTQGLTIWELGKNGAEEGRTGSATSFGVGVSKFIARATDISGISEQTFREGYAHADDPNYISRLQYYILYNGENQLREIAEKSSAYYLEEALDSFDDKEVVLYVLSSLGSACVLLVLVFFIPYIMRVERSILSVFDHISNISSNEIKRILEKCYSFKEEIELPYDKLNEVYIKEDFSAALDDLGKEETKEDETGEKGKKGKSKQRKKDEESDEEMEDSDAEDADVSELNGNSEKHYLLLIEKRKMEAKKKMFTNFTNSKRRAYILQLSLLFLFFVVFLVTDVLLLSSFFKKGKKAFSFLSRFAAREYLYKTAVLFYRETLLISDDLHFTSTVVFVHVGNDEVLKQYLEKSFEVEKDVQLSSKDLKSSFPSMEDYMGEIESNKYCEYFTDSTSSKAIQS